jgi:hypothetical protein
MELGTSYTTLTDVAAKRGSVTMLIWLGKQLLGQRDEPIDSDDSVVDRWLAHLKSGG